MTANEDLSKIIDIIKDHPIAMLTTQGPEGLLSHPMTVLKVEDDGELWFFSSAGTTPVENIEQRAQVNVSFAAKDQWLSVQGEAAVITSEPKARELWNPAVAAFYPDGPESPELRLVRVRPDGAEYWQTPGGTLATALSWAKARITGGKMNAGESHTVDL
ncbi:pyridoxamine 5'-phosphate oxidase family protein [Specibacter sp. NPDC057265]|uniref:pyridoxamine 5'-phosphate oxidase family protein n=1 Tax=Specibacter sp. NPDC057265 TaxID=3346075 RepID=UPI003644D610